MSKKYLITEGQYEELLADLLIKESTEKVIQEKVPQPVIKKDTK